MAFIGGPRQVGKTTLALSFLNPPSVKNSQYLNWDSPTDQKSILKNEISFNSKIFVFDEIHKFAKWRNFIKGVYDKNYEDHQFIITGSARLDHFRKGGDSLLGRYRYFRLHPLTISELDASASEIQALLQFGGFPEPYFSQNQKDHKLWLSERNYRLVRDDIKDLTAIKETSLIALLLELLPDRVGSLLSLNSLSEDLQVSQPSIDRWLTELEHLYYCYRIAPYGSNKIRAIKKIQKLYLWDWSEISNSGARFENMVAGHLLKMCHFLEDTEGDRYELRYLRDTDGHEVDFVVLKNKKALFAVECKTGESALSKSIHYFKEKLDIPEFYQIHLGKKDYGNAKNGRVLPFKVFCQEKNLV
ncbi:MAG: ATP-binding protein [Pseudobdellovibrionaceae bacterium]